MSTKSKKKPEDQISKTWLLRRVRALDKQLEDLQADLAEADQKIEFYSEAVKQSDKTRDKARQDFEDLKLEYGIRRFNDRVLEEGHNTLLFVSMLQFNGKSVVSKLDLLDSLIAIYKGKDVPVPGILLNPTTCNELFGCSNRPLTYCGIPLATSVGLAENTALMLSLGYKH